MASHLRSEDERSQKPASVVEIFACHEVNENAETFRITPRQGDKAAFDFAEDKGRLNSSHVVRIRRRAMWGAVNERRPIVLRPRWGDEL